MSGANYNYFSMKKSLERDIHVKISVVLNSLIINSNTTERSQLPLSRIILSAQVFDAPSLGSVIQSSKV